MNERGMRMEREESGKDRNSEGKKMGVEEEWTGKGRMGNKKEKKVD